MVWVELDPDKCAEHRSRLAELVHQLVNHDSLVRFHLVASHAASPAATTRNICDIGEGSMFFVVTSLGLMLFQLYKAQQIFHSASTTFVAGM